MNPRARERLYALLPEIYRIRDVDQGEPLRALLAVMEEELATIEGDLDALYDNWFIETCDEWVVPYIGDLLGVGDLNLSQALPPSQRALVARTIRYRRWKGTVKTLANVIHDATGWPAVVVEGYKRLALTHSVRHPDPTRPGFVDLRQLGHLGLADPARDRSAHLTTFDDRGATEGSAPTDRPSYNLADVNLFISRLPSYPDRRGSARRIQPGCYTFNPFGLDAPLLAADCWGKDGALPPIPGRQFVVADLGDWSRPPATGNAPLGAVAVDPVRGRLAFPADEDPERVEVSYTYGFSADLGGGVYDRWSTLTQPDDDTWYATVGGAPSRAGDRFPRFSSLAAALQAWALAGRPGLIRITDSLTYALPPDKPVDPGYRIDLAGTRRLAIEGANEQCPCLIGNLIVTGDHPNAQLHLNGLWLDGTVALGGNVELDLRHCTLRPFPDRPSIHGVEAYEPNLRVSIDWSILGSVQLSGGALGVRIEDTIVDGAGGPALAGPGGGFGPASALARTTILGPVKVGEIVQAVDCLFRERVDVHRLNAGQIRTSFVPEGSRTPRRHRCQPDLALDQAGAAERAALLQRLKPSFTSTSFGDPAYAQLSRACPEEIKTGSSLGSEVGAFHHLHQYDREARLRAVLDDFLPYQLRPRIVYVS